MASPQRAEAIRPFHHPADERQRLEGLGRHLRW